MKQNIARDLLLLAAVAYRNGRYEDAGSLFATSMSSSDATELLQELDIEGDLGVDDLQPPSGDWESESSDAPRAGLESISKSLADAMSLIPSLSASEDVDTPDLEDEEEEDSDDAVSDDFNPGMPGQKIVPSSLSSANHGGGSRPTRLVMGSKSPVGIKQ